MSYFSVFSGLAVTSGAKKETVARMMAGIQEQHNTSMSMMNMSMLSHYSIMKNITTMAGNLYR